MSCSDCQWKAVLATALGCLALLVTIPVQAQQLASTAKTDAAVVVDGVVKQVFRNLQQSEIPYIVQIEVQRSEVRQSLPAGSKLQFPAPGQLIYVQVVQPRSAGQLLNPRGQRAMIPNANSQLKAYLVAGPNDGWAGTYPEWFDGSAAATAEAEPADASWNQPARSSLGVTTEVTQVQGNTALKVTSVERGSAAQKAGLEEGDLIVGVNKTRITEAAQLDAAARLGKPFSIVVADVRSGRVVPVEIDPSAGDGNVAASSPPIQTSAKPKRTPLGISAEPVRVGLRSALKVTRVEPGSPAQKAGLEPEDIIVEANGVSITGPEPFVQAVRKSGPKLELVVRDSRTNKNTPVTVDLGGPELTTPNWPPASTASKPGQKSDLGVVTELAFHNDEFAVKISEVQPGSPAQRAGLQPGMLILKVNNQPVLHPTELSDAVRQSGQSVNLQIVDPRSGQIRNATVSLSGF